MLRIAIQTKGRLNEQSMDLLHEIGIDVDAAKRKFLSQAANFPIEVLYLRDDDIPQVVANGTASLGIVGLNEVAERGCDVEVVKKLGFDIVPQNKPEYFCPECGAPVSKGHVYCCQCGYKLPTAIFMKK